MENSVETTDIEAVKNDTDISTWKWSDGTEVPINELDLYSCFMAAIHSLKRMRFYSDQVRFFEYKLDVAKSDRQRAKAQANIKRCKDVHLFFAEKFEHLSEQAETLGKAIPSKFEDVKEILNTLEKPKSEEEKVDDHF